MHDHVKIQRPGPRPAFEMDQIDRHAGMRGRKTLETRQQPVLRERHAHAHPQARRRRGRPTASPQIGHSVEKLASGRHDGLSRDRSDNAARCAFGQRDAHESFELSQPVTYRALRQPQFFRRARHAAEPEGCIQGDKTVERRECAHPAIMNEIHEIVKHWNWRPRRGCVQHRAVSNRCGASVVDHQISTSAHREYPKFLPALVLGMAAFLTQFDVTAVVVAMPSIAADLRLDTAGYAWMMDAYSLAFTGTLLAAGAIADRYGRRRALMAGNIVFMIASLLCGAATSGSFLFAVRALQGIGAAFVITGGISLLASSYPAPDDRARAFGLMGVISGVAMAMGPTLGGLIASWIGWQWIFLANIPVCFITLLAAPILIAETSDAEGRSLDWAGVALLTLALGTMIESLLAGGDASLRMLGGFVISAGIVAIYILQQRRRTTPIFDPAVFARPVMMGVGALLLALSIAYWSILFTCRCISPSPSPGPA